MHRKRVEGSDLLSYPTGSSCASKRRECQISFVDPSSARLPPPAGRCSQLTNSLDPAW